MTGILNNKSIAGLSLLAFMLMPQITQAGCPCSKGGNSYSQPSFPQPSFPQYSPAPVQQQFSPQPQQVAAATPPGTLGRTYYRPSREIPAEKHPRIAMVDVVAQGATEVSLYNIYPHREEDAVEGFENQLTNGLWQFETKPLIPGVPHIYKAVFKFSDAPNAPETVRYIRLIPGRIVQITY